MKKLLITLLTLAFLLSACLPAAANAADVEAAQPIAEDEGMDAEAPHTDGMAEDESSSPDMKDEDTMDEVAGVEEEDTPGQIEETPAPQQEESGMVNIAYDFLIEPYQGFEQETVSLLEVVQNGNPTVVNFFASGCPICVAEMSHLENAYQEFGESVNFVAVDIGPHIRLGTNEDAVQLLADRGATFPAGNTSDVQVLREYSVLGTPTTVFFNSDGSINEIYTGFLSYDQFVTYISVLN